jgi:hypothetical protein
VGTPDDMLGESVTPEPNAFRFRPPGNGWYDT